jgi:hypothetical protein
MNVLLLLLLLLLLSACLQGDVRDFQWYGVKALSPEGDPPSGSVPYIHYDYVIKLGKHGRGRSPVYGIAWDVAAIACGQAPDNYADADELAQVGVACTCISLLRRLLKSNCEWAAGR